MSIATSVPLNSSGLNAAGVTSPSAAVSPKLASAIQGTVDALRRMADHELPLVVERRMHELGERKDMLDAEQKAEYLAIVEYWREFMIEKSSAMVALKRLQDAAPELLDLP